MGEKASVTIQGFLLMTRWSGLVTVVTVGMRATVRLAVDRVCGVIQFSGVRKHGKRGDRPPHFFPPNF